MKTATENVQSNWTQPNKAFWLLTSSFYLMISHVGFGQETPIVQFGETELLIPSKNLGSKLAVGDLDGDGDSDLMTVLDSAGGFRIFLLQDDGTFSGSSRNASGLRANHIELNDVDQDGDLDAWISSGYGYDPVSPNLDTPPIRNSLWFNQGNATFERSDAMIGANTRQTLIGDLDQDGDKDAILIPVIYARWNTPLQVWLNDGANHFAINNDFALDPNTNVNCGFDFLPGKLADFNSDDRIDWFNICNSEGQLLLGADDGQLRDSKQHLINTTIITPSSGSNIAVGDLDGDTDLDIVVPNENFHNTIWLNNGLGHFVAGHSDIGGGGRYATTVDLDLDGDLDIAISSSEIRVYWNDGSGQFLKGQVISERGSREPFFMDIDHDSDKDLIYRTSDGLVARRNEISFLTPHANDVSVSIPDPQLERAIRVELGLSPTFPITQGNLFELKKLDCSRNNWGLSVPTIENLKGFELATNLTELDLSGSSIPCLQIADFELLSQLPKLRTLNLGGNQIERVDLSRGFDQLETLLLFDRSLRSLELPPELPALKKLQVGGSLSVLTLPNSLPNVEILGAGASKITDIVLPQSAPKLRRLFLSDNRLKHLNIPIDATNLEWLSLRGNQLESIRLPRITPELFYIDLSENRALKDWTFLTKLTSLRHLDIRSSTFDPRSLLAPLPTLEVLIMESSPLESITFPKGYKTLKELRLAGSEFRRISLPEDLNQLEVLDLTNTNLRDFQLPPGLKSVRQLNLGSSNIQSLDIPSDMESLAFLDLSENGLQTLSIPEEVGSRAGTSQVNLANNRIEKLQIPRTWRIPTQMTSALIMLEETGMTNQGEFRLGIFGGSGTLLIQKSTDLRRWETIHTTEYQPDGKIAPYRDPIDDKETNAFYRVRLQAP